MKKILISLLLLCVLLVSVSCNQEKPLKYEIEITEKLTSIGYQYHSFRSEYTSITYYRFKYHYKTIFPEGSTNKGRYEEGD